MACFGVCSSDWRLRRLLFIAILSAAISVLSGGGLIWVWRESSPQNNLLSSVLVGSVPLSSDLGTMPTDRGLVSLNKSTCCFPVASMPVCYPLYPSGFLFSRSIDLDSRDPGVWKQGQIGLKWLHVLISYSWHRFNLISEMLFLFFCCSEMRPISGVNLLQILLLAFSTSIGGPFSGFWPGQIEGDIGIVDSCCKRLLPITGVRHKLRRLEHRPNPSSRQLFLPPVPLFGTCLEAVAWVQTSSSGGDQF